MIRIVSAYLVQMREDAGKMRTRITPNTDSFCAVFHSLKIDYDEKATQHNI